MQCFRSEVLQWPLIFINMFFKKSNKNGICPWKMDRWQAVGRPFIPWFLNFFANKKINTWFSDKCKTAQLHFVSLFFAAYLSLTLKSNHTGHNYAYYSALSFYSHLKLPTNHLVLLKTLLTICIRCIRCVDLYHYAFKSSKAADALYTLWRNILFRSVFWGTV